MSGNSRSSGKGASEGSGKHPQRIGEEAGTTGDGKRGKPEWAGGLRQLYDSIVDEPLPDTFHDLLARLDNEDGGAAGEAQSGRDAAGRKGNAH
ncbi:MAG: NepR family anti-sigma factor [Erythrobacter sp.]|jgi:hypothetical protein|nr:NepR family anti-sigma factor [Erythrobacter sp.]